MHDFFFVGFYGVLASKYLGVVGMVGGLVWAHGPLVLSLFTRRPKGGFPQKPPDSSQEYVGSLA